MTSARAALDRLLPPGSRRRSTAATVLVVIVALGGSQVALPRPAPGGVLFAGLLQGAAHAMAAVGIVLVYRSSRVINFAQAALGAAGAYLVFVLVGLFDWPFVAALPLALLAGAATGALVDVLFVQRFFYAPRLVLTVVTIVLSALLARTPSMIDRIGPVGRAGRDLTRATAAAEARVPTPFPDFSFRLEPYTFGFPALLTIVLALAAFAGLAVFLRATRLGSAVRGAAENADRALSLGINVRLLSTIVWTVAGALAAAALLSQSMNTSFAGVRTFSPQLLIPALAAAVLGRMASLPVTAVAAMTIGMLQEAVFWSYRGSAAVDILLLVVIAAGLLAQRRRVLRSEDAVTSSWEATKEIRSVPHELRVVPGVRRARRALLAAALVAVVVFPYASSSSQTNLGGLICIQAVVALSLVVLTGWGGQVSLGQFAFVAVAAVVGSHLTGDVGLSFWLALPLVAALTAGFAALVGLPALRIRGAFLAVTTLAFAVATQQALFNTAVFTRLIPDRVDRPRLFFVSFAGERSYYYLCLGFLVVCAFVVSRLRRSRTGRVLIALRDNPSAVQTFGVPLLRTRLAAFALSGALAGVAGMLFVHHQRAVDAASYGADVSVAMFILAMIGGISSVTGALLGAAYVGIADFVVADPVFRMLATTGGLLGLLVVAPGGLVSIAAGVRDSVLRIVALRRGIAVPSLFEDSDEAALAARRTPLAEPIPGSGLDAIPRSRRYRVSSELHGVRA